MLTGTQEAADEQTDEGIRRDGIDTIRLGWARSKVKTDKKLTAQPPYGKVGRYENPPNNRESFTSDENRTRTSTSCVDVLASWGAHDRSTTATGNLGDGRRGCKQALCRLGSGPGQATGDSTRGKDPQVRGCKQTMGKEAPNSSMGK